MEMKEFKGFEMTKRNDYDEFTDDDDASPMLEAEWKDKDINNLLEQGANQTTTAGNSSQGDQHQPKNSNDRDFSEVNIFNSPVLSAQCLGK